MTSILFRCMVKIALIIRLQISVINSMFLEAQGLFSIIMLRFLLSFAKTNYLKCNY